MNQSEALANFVAITGADDSEAEQMLLATNFDLQAAIDLFFAAGGLDADANVLPQQQQYPPTFDTDVEDDEALARRLQSESNAIPAEEHVRAPIPTHIDRLYGNVYHDPVHRHRQQENPVPVGVVDAFRNFSGQSLGDGDRLASLFEPPRNLIFHGDFEEAKAQAVSEGKWLILNVQNTSDFASHQLNRDTWRNSSIAALVESTFILYQAYTVTDLGQKLLSFYNIYEVPSIIVIDPVTGAPMKLWTGFMSPEKLIDELMPFLDTNFNDPGASRLAVSLKKRQSGLGRQTDDSVDDAIPATEQKEEEYQHQDEELAYQGDMPSVPPAAAAAPIKSSKEVMAEAAARLSEEPFEGPDSCRIAVRFPHGVRLQRRFLRNATLHAVHDWCLTQSEEAAGGRKFHLSEAMPGAPSIVDLHVTLADAKVTDAMLVMKWSD